ncbi:hypothetical protein AN644_00980 [Candidatus Epulonipiscium fishelsonii]|nr:hypothetical protein AN644_00980 [Epulopiscium sp. SCG-C06WGA-EpuloA1]
MYDQAYKKAKANWNSRVNQGEAGTLLSLDGVVHRESILTEVSIGTIDIPIDKIVGTYSHSRAISFSNNFMPLMKPNSEFGAKWSSLYTSHITEGLREPIKVYEYLNYFYVVEGNKRVSVLKFVGATSYQAQVTRLVPKQDEHDKINIIYYEFIYFYRETKINTIWFNEIGKFPMLLNLINQYIDKYQYNEDQYKLFIANLYRPFRQIYKAQGGDRLNITTGEAFLDYIKINGLNKEITEAEDEKSIKAFIEELKSINKQQPNVETKPIIASKKKNILSTMSGLMSSKKPLKIAFVYAKTPDTSGWAYSHELGRLHINNIFKNQIETFKIENVPENHNASKIFRQLANENFDIVFTTSPTFVTPALKIAMEYPDVKFFNCATTYSYKSLTLYFGRIHEPKYILGMIAGVMTKNNIIGYVAPYPISEVISSLNAFTLGVKSVNPTAIVKTLWTHRWDHTEQSKDIDSKLIQLGVDIISNEDLPIAGDMSKYYGIYSVDPVTNEKKHYAMTVWNWGLFYEKVIKNILNGTWKSLYENVSSDEKPRNFWLGMDTGIVDIFYSNRNINPQLKNLINCVKNGIISKEFDIFRGPIYNQEGQLKINIGETCDYDKIINMDWLVQGIEGTLPDASTLAPNDPFSYMLNIIKRG